MVKKNKKVLFIVNHRKNRSPGQRFRFEQYISFLEENGYSCEFSILLSESDDKIIYSPKNFFNKGIIFLKCLLIRTRNLIKMNKYDIIFIYREAFITGSSFFERRFSKSSAKIIFDFDDSVWLQNVSEANKRLSFLKDASKTSKIISKSNLIFAGNKFLEDYAKKFNNNVVVIPTTIDTDSYKHISSKTITDALCIGWSGSFSTIQHFAFAIPALKKIKEKFDRKVKFKIIGDENYYCKELETQGVKWNLSSEIQDLSEIDIGIMPLPDNEWTKGKCGLKGLQYMALGIPTLMSPVGVNIEIIQSGKNGYLPATEDEWVNYLSLLINDSELRKTIGKEGRKTVVERYSVNIWKNKYLEYFNQLSED